MKKALIVGIGGQDGSYLADILLEKKYEVHGIYRRSSGDNLGRIRHLLTPSPRVKLWQGDLADCSSILRILYVVQPDEVYNMADQDHVTWSRSLPLYASQITYGGVATLLEILRLHGKPGIRFFQPLSATMFSANCSPTCELMPIEPQSPYACAKAGAYHLCRHYRIDHEMFVSTGIFFSHDSPRRGDDYLLQKIARWALLVAKHGPVGCPIPIDGDLSDEVEVGYAREYMEEAAVVINNLPKPDDFVIGQGKTNSLWDLCNFALGVALTDPSYIKVALPPQPPRSRPTFYADITKAQREFGFSPRYDTRLVLQMIINNKRGGS